MRQTQSDAVRDQPRRKSEEQTEEGGTKKRTPNSHCQVMSWLWVAGNSIPHPKKETPTSGAHFLRKAPPGCKETGAAIHRLPVQVHVCSSSSL